MLTNLGNLIKMREKISTKAIDVYRIKKLDRRIDR